MMNHHVSWWTLAFFPPAVKPSITLAYHSGSKQFPKATPDKSQVTLPRPMNHQHGLLKQLVAI
jgi:hypothetical protein